MRIILENIGRTKYNYSQGSVISNSILRKHFSLINHVIPSWTNVDRVCFLSDAQVKCEM